MKATSKNTASAKDRYRPWNGQLFGRPDLEPGSAAMVSVIEDFQRAHGLAVDGVCGPLTFEVALPARVAELNATIPDVFRGYGMWIWTLKPHEVESVITQCADKAYRRINVKVSEGTSRLNGPAMVSLAAAAEAAGIPLMGWHWPRMSNAAEREADLLADCVADYGLQGVTIDAEKHVLARRLLPGKKWAGKRSKRAGALAVAAQWARRFMTRLRERLGDAFPIAFSSFPIVRNFPDMPYEAWLELATLNTPMCYPYGREPIGHIRATLAGAVLFGRPCMPILATNLKGSGGLQSFKSQLDTVANQYQLPGVDLYRLFITDSSIARELAPGARPSLDTSPTVETPPPMVVTPLPAPVDDFLGAYDRWAAAGYPHCGELFDAMTRARGAHAA